MCNNILSYICFFILCGLVVCDMWFSTNILLQIVCILLVCVVVCLTGYIAHKWHKGNYLSNEQANSYQAYLSENLALTKELDYYKTKQQKNKISSTELQNLVLINTRLTAQNSNLKTRVELLSELLAIAQQSKQTPVVAMPEQLPEQQKAKIA